MFSSTVESPVSLLLNAARAYAIIAYADGRPSLAEAHRFAAFAEEDPDLASDPAAVAAAWSTAEAEVAASAADDAEPMARLIAEVLTQGDKAAVMRAAQAAIVSDGRLAVQEDGRIAELAAALGLDPAAY